MTRLDCSVAFIIFGAFLLGACGERLQPAVNPTSIPPLSPTSPLLASTSPASLTPAPTSTLTPTVTMTPLPSSTPTTTRTPTISTTPTITLTPTPDFPDATVLLRAFCRYGPGKAYLYSDELNIGDHVEVRGRSMAGSWLWVKPDDLDRNCWVAPSVIEIQGDITKLNRVTTRLPHSTLYGPPDDVEASRSGDSVTVSWERVWMTEDDDRGYLIEATVCQSGSLLSVAVQTTDTSYEFTDEAGCSGASGGKLYTVEKHGYTDPVEIPWP